jgi:DDE superfamily endonuclease
MVAGVVDPGKLVFVDECGTHTSLAPVYGYSPKGERLKLSVSRNRGKNTTLLASMSLEGMGPSMVVHGSTTAGVFEAYLEHRREGSPTSAPYPELEMLRRDRRSSPRGRPTRSRMGYLNTHG